jgi:1,2-diacylglycerol 3-alpha-glucosyltransferase
MLVCSGLEHAHRGFESFARECFEELRDEPGLDLELLKGTGPSGDRERAVQTITRDGRLARMFRRRQNGPIYVEQLAFALSLQPQILKRRPEVIYFSEWYTGVGLNFLRAVNRQRYALVLSNGSMAAEGFEPFDRIHQHTAPAYEYVLAHGADPAKQALLPVAFKFSPTLELLSDDERRALRERLGLPVDRTIVISVAALNRHHKRLDYVIEELAQLPEPRPYLLLVGQPEAETEGLRSLASRLLGEDGHGFRSVPRKEVDLLLPASDVFVLASFAEGLPRALVEAMDRGLPCLAHDYAIPRYAMGSHGRLADLSQRGALAGLLADGEVAGWDDPVGAEARHQYVYDAFSWDQLRAQYVELLRGAVGRADFASRPLSDSGSGPAHEQNRR